MGLQFYKPNKNNTGGACSLSFNSKEGCVFIELVKQNGWDAAGRSGQGNGIFKGGDKVNVKLSLAEVGGMIRAVENNLAGAPQMIHKGENGTKTVRFVQWPAPTPPAEASYKGWSLSAMAKDKDGKETKAACSFSFDEAIIVREYLKLSLVHIFTAIYSADKKRAEDYAKQNGGQATPVATPKTKAKAEKPKSVEEFVKPEETPAPAPAPAPSEGDDGQF